jgi:outer membrane receptor protein involved in Fe transport
VRLGRSIAACGCALALTTLGINCGEDSAELKNFKQFVEENVSAGDVACVGLNLYNSGGTSDVAGVVTGTMIERQLPSTPQSLAQNTADLIDDLDAGDVTQAMSDLC